MPRGTKRGLPETTVTLTVEEDYVLPEIYTSSPANVCQALNLGAAVYPVLKGDQVNLSTQLQITAAVTSAKEAWLHEKEQQLQRYEEKVKEVEAMKQTYEALRHQSEQSQKEAEEQIQLLKEKGAASDAKIRSLIEENDELSEFVEEIPVGWIAKHSLEVHQALQKVHEHSQKLHEATVELRAKQYLFLRKMNNTHNTPEVPCADAFEKARTQKWNDVAKSKKMELETELGKEVYEICQKAVGHIEQVD